MNPGALPVPWRPVVVSPEYAKRRLDVFVAQALPHLSRSRVQALIEQGNILLNQKPVRAREMVRTGDVVSVREPPPQPAAVTPEDISLNVLFEDEYLLVLDKPAGMAVHPGAGLHSGTLVNALLARPGSLSSIGGEARPGIVHRLDKDTTGCLVVAKTDQVHLRLSRQFAGREVIKWYLAICRGVLKQSPVDIKAPIGRHPVQRHKMAVTPRGRPARTTFTLAQRLAAGSLLHCRLWTGRTHQIRVHLQELHNPLCGDPVYGGADPRFPRPLLHAWQLGFFHPADRRWMNFIAQVPDDFVRLGVDTDELIRKWPRIPDPAIRGESAPSPGTLFSRPPGPDPSDRDE
ncbi:MAG: RluA family pseudouridine synthase [Verrucomicrobia bacterium]|nr:RluA family pseudouridine synthase [Verrucomicrobiota bacterium]